MLFQLILAFMLALAPPGESPYSVVPARCADDGVCSAAERTRWDQDLQTRVRRENDVEATERYVQIAGAIVRVAIESSAPNERGEVLWPWGHEDLAKALTAASFHESGFRRDVHSGVGLWALGDCHRKDNGARLTTEEQRDRTIARVCRSYCLAQINTGGPAKRYNGVRGRDLVGLDDASTERCFTAAAQKLAEARRSLSAKGARTWFSATIARYGGGGPTTADWVVRRTTTFDSFAGDPPPLTPLAAVLLGLPETVDPVSRLEAPVLPDPEQPRWTVATTNR